MTNLSVHICDTSASLVLTSASYADNSLNSISSSYALQSVSASWAPDSTTTGFSGVVQIPLTTFPFFINATFTGGLLTSTSSFNPYMTNNVLYFYTTSSVIPALTITNPSGLVNEHIDGWTAVVGIGCVNMTQLAIYTNPLIYVNLSGSTSLSNLDCNDSDTLQTIDISGLPALTYLDLSSNALTTTCVDSVLGNLVNFGLTNGTVLLHNPSGQGGINSAPSAAGYASASILTSRGWSVTTQ
jgi:Leucine-rich repeat (LRR) protein